MVWVPGGTFLMGSDHHYREAPASGPGHNFCRYRAMIMVD